MRGYQTLINPTNFPGLSRMIRTVRFCELGKVVDSKLDFIITK